MAQLLVQHQGWKSWRGKLAGSAAGLAIGGPIGALVGAVAGHAYDHYRKAFVAVEDALIAIEPETIEPARNTAQTAAFTIGVIALGAMLAQADRGMDSKTVYNFRRVFGLPEKHVPLIRRMFEQALFDQVGYRPYAHQLAQLFMARPEKLEELVVGLIRFARNDNNLNDRTLDYLRQLSGIFGIAETRFAKLLLIEGVFPPVPANARDAFAVLGVSSGAPEIAVKQAYRDLMREYHPDKIARTASTPADLASANDRVSAINAAYAEVKRARGWI